MSRLLRQLDRQREDRRLRTELRKSWKRGAAVSVLLALLAVSGSGVWAAATGGDPLDVFTAHLDERVPELMASYAIPGVVMSLIQEGQVVWAEAYGHADVEAGRDMVVGTISRTESISKSVTAWGVMTLVESGAIDLDDPVTSHVSDRQFPPTPYPIEDITIRQLLNHTAGMPLGTIGGHYPPGGNMPSLEENLHQEARLIAEPGSGFVYSNVGFNLLELLIEEVTGDDFAEYMEREVLEPLGMDHSSYTWSEDPTPPIGYELDGTPVLPYVYPERGSGGLLAPVEDVARFIAAGMTGPHYVDHDVLSFQSLEELYTPNAEISGIFGFVADSYGLGHFVETLGDGRQAVWHGGQGHGWMTHFHSLPETGTGIVILTNSQRSWPMIASLLGDWSEWNNLPPVGMTFITRATTAAWVTIVTSAGLSLVLLWRVASGLVSGHRRLAPLSPQSRVPRLGRALLAVLLILIIGMSAAQDLWTFFITPLFPNASTWLSASTLALAVALLCSAVTPPLQHPFATDEKERGDNEGVSVAWKRG